MARRIIYNFYLLIILSFVVNKTNAQEFSTSLSFKNNNTKKQTIKFELANNLIIIPLKINNSQNLNFILDSGQKETLITELPVDVLGKLKFTEESTLGYFGKNSEIEVRKTYGNQIDIDKISGNYQTLYVVKNSEYKLSKRYGIEINGIIGADIFNNFIVEINYTKKELTFTNYEFYDNKKTGTGFREFPLELIDEKPYIRASLVSEIQKPNIVKEMISTGVEDACLIYLTNENQPIECKKNREELLVAGLNCSIQGKIGRINKIELGELTFSNVTCSFPDKTETYNGLKTGFIKGQGIIGAEILSRFDIIFDYQNAKISLKPNKSFDNDFNFDMCGIEIEAPYKILPVYNIKKIRKNSPAEEAGFKEGDQIISVDGISSMNLSISEINNLFRSKEGKVFVIKIMRNGEVSNLSIQLIRDL